MKETSNSRIRRRIIALSLGFGLFVWVADGVADFFVFYRGESLIDLLFAAPPPHEIYIRTLIGVLFVVFGLIFSRHLERERETSAKLAQALDEKELLLREVHHRVKNNLFVILSLLRLQMGQSPNAKESLDWLHTRINSIALIHKRLYRSHDLSKLDLAGYFDELVDEAFSLHDMRHIALRKRFDSVTAHLDVAVPCGLILNECIQNACKHAFSGRENGTITVRLRRHTGGFELEVYDDGVGASASTLAKPAASSLGLSLVRSLADQVNGELEISGVGGVRNVLKVPLRGDRN